ncbi:MULTISPECIES: hypothetical protein [unclassified Plantibacter]|uniref:hypothetical protein n=1 Tax=unclassified Plantibacter TaxID=2624265 RepID=UPI000AB28DB0|nr:MULTISPECIES: hypothetical protein [unclassified Plantibacter]
MEIVNLGRFIGSVLLILAGCAVVVFRKPLARGIDRGNTRLHGRLWIHIRGRRALSPSTLIAPGIAWIAIGIWNIAHSLA